MMAPGDSLLDPNESFPRPILSHILDASIQWRARPGKPLDPDRLDEELASRFPEYPAKKRVHDYEVVPKARADAESDRNQKRRWQGMRLRSRDGKNIVQFMREGLAFRRTKDYGHWEPFVEEARTAWRVFREIAQPIEIERLVVGFINHFPEATPQSVGRYLREPPTCPSSLPLKEFFYQSTFDVPGRPLQIRVLKAFQISKPGVASFSGLFLDIVVSTTHSMPVDGVEMDEVLADSRLLKNKVFHDLITDAAADALGRSKT